MFDSNMYEVAIADANEAISTGNFAGTVTVYVKPTAAGAVTIEQSPADATDPCVDAGDWSAVQTTDACATPPVTADAVIDITDEEVAAGGVCAVKINCLDDFIRFSVPVVVIGQARRSNIQPIQVGCKPNVI